MNDEYLKARDAAAEEFGHYEDHFKAGADWAHEFSTRHHKLYEDYEQQLEVANAEIEKWKSLVHVTDESSYKAVCVRQAEEIEWLKGILKATQSDRDLLDECNIKLNVELNEVKELLKSMAEALRGSLGWFALFNEENDRAKWPKYVGRCERSLAAYAEWESKNE